MNIKTSFAASLAILLATINPIPALADGDVACGSTGSYRVTGTTVVSSTNCTGSVVIDNTITAIGSRAFDNQSIYLGGTNSNANVTSLTIGENVIEIASNAFRLSAGNLTTLVIPDSVTTIGSSAFYDARSLTSLTLGSGLTQIGNAAFRGTTSLTQVVLPPMLNTLGRYSFSFSGITSLTIPGSLEIVTYESLSNMSALETLVFSEGVQEIEDFAVTSASSLTSLTLPNSLNLIGNYAFTDMQVLKELVIPNAVTYIGDSAFDGARDLERLTIGSSLNDLGSDVFGSMGQLTCFTNFSALIQLDILYFDDALPICLPPVVTPATQAPAAPNKGTIITGLTPRQITTRGGAIVRFSGNNMQSVTEVKVDGELAKIVSQNQTELSISLPSHEAGKASIVLTSPTSIFAFDSALEFIETPDTAQTFSSAISIAGNKVSVLSQAQRARVSHLAKMASSTTLECKAQYAKGVSRDMRIANYLASEACALAKSKNPKLKTIVTLSAKKSSFVRTLTLKFGN